MKLLIVDDSLMDRRLLTRLLQKANVPYPILEATDGQEALKIVSENYKDIKLIFLDWQMPNMDGLEFMRGMVKVKDVSHIPIVMVSASGSDENKKQAYDVNPKLAGYIVKPFNPETLLNTIKPYL
ncbi:MAG: response regulator [Candidatus Omnitrophica bacterium]|nr:response regulator [Candidatus Omnitrophota bacterium]